MSRSTICVATMHPDQNVNGSIQRYPGDIPTWTALSHDFTKVHVRYNTTEDNLGVVRSYQKLYEESDEDLLAYLHDDVICREEGWNERVTREFEDPNVGVVGFGGALLHGVGDVYKTPYRLQQLGRQRYFSNVDDAEVHGERFTGSREVSVIDGYAIVIRRELLDKAGGWPINTPIGYIGYDYWASCMAHELGYKIKVVGLRCHHKGGGTFVAMKMDQNGQKQYDDAHRYIYDRFRNVLPWRCS